MFLWTLRFLTLCACTCNASIPDDTKASVFKEVQTEVFHAISLPPEQRRLLPTEMQENFDQELEKRAQTIFANTNMYTITTGNPSVRQEIVLVTGVMRNETMHFNPILCIVIQDSNDQWSVAHTHPLTLPAISCKDTTCSLQDSVFVSQPHQEAPSVGGFFRYKSSSLSLDRFHHVTVRWDGQNDAYVISSQASSLPLEPAKDTPNEDNAKNSEKPLSASKDKDKDGNPTVIAPNFSTGGGSTTSSSTQKDHKKRPEDEQKSAPSGPAAQQQTSTPNAAGKDASGLELPKVSLPGLPRLPKTPRALPSADAPQAAHPDAPVDPAAATDAPEGITPPTDAAANDLSKKSALLPEQNLHLKGAGTLKELSSQEFSIDLNTLTAVGL